LPVTAKLGESVTAYSNEGLGGLGIFEYWPGHYGRKRREGIGEANDEMIGVGILDSSVFEVVGDVGGFEGCAIVPYKIRV
jgi:hypothetical protein